MTEDADDDEEEKKAEVSWRDIHHEESVLCIQRDLQMHFQILPFSSPGIPLKWPTEGIGLDK